MDVDNLQNMITNLEGVGKGADTFLGSADSFIKTTDKQLSEDLKQLHVTLLNLKVVTTYAKELVGSARRKSQTASSSAANQQRSRLSRKS